MDRVKRLKEQWQGLCEIGGAIWRNGDHDFAERVDDVLQAMERIEKVDLPRARAKTRQELAALRAERKADPDAYEATRVRIPEGAPAGWVADPAHRARMSPALLRRIQEDDAREAMEAAREERARAQLVAQREDDAIMESWRNAVAAGTATVADLAGWKLETVGRTHSENLQHYSAVQDAEDQRLQAAAVRYGQMVAAAFGADGDEALAQLLEGKQAPVGYGRERGWG